MKIRPIAGAIASIACAASAQAVVLTFPDNVCARASSGVGALRACSDYSFVNQAYGDSAFVDVAYADVNTPGDSLRWNGPGYNDLPSAIFANGGDTRSHARLTLTPVAGHQVRLLGLDLGAFFEDTLSTRLTVSEAGQATRFSYAGPVGSGAQSASSFGFDLTSTAGFVIEWQDTAFNVGLSNLAFEVSAVPEPASVALLMGGLLGLGALRRSRRA